MVKMAISKKLIYMFIIIPPKFQHHISQIKN